MKLRDVLELTQTQPLSKIAKERLTIGEKTARQALKAAGCYAISGKRGWFYDGDPAVLEQSIYDYVPNKERVKAKATIEKANASITEAIASVEKVKPNKKQINEKQNEHASELDTLDILLQASKMKAEQKRIYRGFYWDEDILKVLDSIKHGNKSDVVNEALRKVFREKGLL
jgi:hypothetical protein